MRIVERERDLREGQLALAAPQRRLVRRGWLGPHLQREPRDRERQAERLGEPGGLQLVARLGRQQRERRARAGALREQATRPGRVVGDGRGGPEGPGLRRQITGIRAGHPAERGADERGIEARGDRAADRLASGDALVGAQRQDADLPGRSREHLQAQPAPGRRHPREVHVEPAAGSQLGERGGVVADLLEDELRRERRVGRTRHRLQDESGRALLGHPVRTGAENRHPAVAFRHHDREGGVREGGQQRGKGLGEHHLDRPAVPAANLPHDGVLPAEESEPRLGGLPRRGLLAGGKPAQ